MGRRPGHGPDAFLDTVHDALDQDHPQGLLELTSSLIELTTPRPADRWTGKEAHDRGLGELVESFLEVPLPETTALLYAIAALDSDDLRRRRIANELRRRDDSMLARWVPTVGEMDITGVREGLHVLRDGDNHLIGVRWPSGHEMTALVYIDHNAGTIVKDAFCLPQGLRGAEALWRRLAGPEAAEVTSQDLDPADARARITEGIEHGAITVPPFESDTWPAQRPMIEWVVRHLPEGGRGYELPEWTAAETDALVRTMLASPAFDHLRADDDTASLLDSLVWYGTGYTLCDPYRWSAVTVEIVLTDWFPRKIAGDQAYLAKMPDVLRALVRHAHGERGIDVALTDEVLAAVDTWEPAYRDAIADAGRPMGAAAIAQMALQLSADGPTFAALDGFVDDDFDFGEDDFDEDDLDPEELIEALIAGLGGREFVEGLDTRPHPDEPVAWSRVPEHLRPRTEEVVAVTDRVCDELLDVEYRTMLRRAVVDLAEQDPAAVTRGRADVLAGALIRVVGEHNGLVGYDPRRPADAPHVATQKLLAEVVGAGAGPISTRALSLQHKVATQPDARFLHSSIRRVMVELFEQRELLARLLDPDEDD